MSEDATDMDAATGRAELQGLLLELGNNVESLFADAVVALLADTSQTVDDLRAEDYKVHEKCLEIDSLCIERLTDGALEEPEVRFTLAADKMATDLKHVADECLRIGEGLRTCGEELGELRNPADSLLRLAELTQGMLSDGLEALVNGDATQASALHLVFREVAGLHRKALGELAGGMGEQELSPRCGIALSGVALRLERVASEVLDMANQVSHVYGG